MNTAELHTTGSAHRSAVGGLIDAAETWAKRYARRQEFRQAFLPLLEERDQILSDIGYQRYDIYRALRLPLKEDAMAYMEFKRQLNEQKSGHTRLTR